MYDSSSIKYGFKRKPNEVQMARGRLKDVLQDLVANSDEESDLNDSLQKLPPRGRPKKFIKSEPEDGEEDGSPPQQSPGSEQQQQQQVHESFVMKLFERSLDLSKYDDRTALYPICRAWMANAPRSTSIKSYRDRRSPSPECRENDGGEVLEKLRNGEIEQINAMPAPLNTEMVRIPPPLVDDETEESRKKTELSLKGASKAQLLSSYKQRWKKVREHWQSHTRRYQEEKYELNYQIIDELYKC